MTFTHSSYLFRGQSGGRISWLALFFFFVSSSLLALQAQEICNNGLDDDLDGFVDFFDPDCACENDNFFGICTSECLYTAGFSNFDFEQVWQSASLIATYATPLVADIDNDGVPEVLAASRNSFSGSPRTTQDILILDANTGATKQTIDTPSFGWGGPTAFAVADIDDDGLGEIIVFCTDGQLRCYENDGTLKWTSTVAVTNIPRNFGAGIGIADFNLDGTPEVYVANNIYNATNGVKIADGGANGIGIQRDEGSVGALLLSAAANLDNDPELELAAGYTIYDVNIGAGTMTPRNITVDAALRDGYTSIADINLDGQLDVVVGHRSTNLGGGTASDSRIYAYYLNGTTPTLIASINPPSGGTNPNVGVPFVGDMDNDGEPEIGVVRSNRLIAYDYVGGTTGAFVQKWLTTTTDASGETGITMFDFNQDGNYELVYRDTDNLRIIDGSGNAAIDFQTVGCTSFTGADMPIVADINGDGAADICVTCNDPPNTGDASAPGRVRIYKSPDRPWAPARKLWNQYGYFVVNINDDLSVPIQQQNHAIAFSAGIPLNNFLVQATLFDKDGSFIFPAADASIDIDASAINITAARITLNMEIINTSAAATALAPGMQVSFFNGNPATGGTIIPNANFTLTEFVNPGQSIGVNHDFAFTFVNPFTLYAVVNNDGAETPIAIENYGQPECDYSNNIDFAVIGDRDGDGIDDVDDIDDDNDGITDIEEGLGVDPAADRDSDGVPNFLDLNDAGATWPLTDVNGDQVIDYFDKDLDGIPNHFDLDSDNDGINDLRESGLTATQIASADADNNGIADGPYGANGLANFIESGTDGGAILYDDPAASVDNDPNGDPVDTDDDNQPDFLDLDSDNDGINDLIEYGLNPDLFDANDDGIVDGGDADDDGLPDLSDGNNLDFGDQNDATPFDTDGDGVYDFRDLDSDNDGINDLVEGGNDALDTNDNGFFDNLDATYADADNDGIADFVDGTPAVFGDGLAIGIGEAQDNDGDGVLNFRDLDSDNDGLNDVIEGFPTGSSPDTNGDGLADGTDGDGDGILSSVDDASGTFGDATDPAPENGDGDTVPDYLDLDSDNDSVNDVEESGNGGLDTNGDGVINGQDAGGSDNDGDGIPDSADGNVGVFGDSGSLPSSVQNTDGVDEPDYRDLDSNNDGNNDINEAGNGSLDTGPPDGRINDLTDPDGDGIVGGADGRPTQFGDGGDADGDGVADAADLDDDNDGIPDIFEASGLAGVDPSADADGDGVPNYVDANFGPLNSFGVVASLDQDSDGIPNHLDLDSDNDGIADVVEAGGIDANGDGILDFAQANTDLADADNNGLIDNIQTADVASDSKLTTLIDGTVAANGGFYYTTGLNRALDTDSDGVPDFLDIDADNDGVYDVVESGGTDTNNNGRIDFSGTFASNDTDGNGWIDSRDGGNGGTSPIITTGTLGSAPTSYNGFDKDGDNVPNFRDLDSDNDGINDIIEAGIDPDDDNGIVDGGVDADGKPTAVINGNTPRNTDGDGAPDYLDLDSDNDGINDIREANLDAFDTNNNGIVDGTDSDGDGIRDLVDGNNGTFGDLGDTAPTDTDGDGVADFRDLDSDNDGINDLTEAGNNAPDTDRDGIVDGPDTDNDGIKDNVDAAPNSFGDNNDPGPSNTDGDGVADYRDLDSDNDGLNDVIEGGFADQDDNGDGLIDGTDVDGDGIRDAADGNDNAFGDANDNTLDTDGDGVLDFRDLDSDNDGINDIVEGFASGSSPDTNGNGVIDNGDAGAPTDADNDGIWGTQDANPTFGDASDPEATDTDGDGVPDYRDLDSDNDSVNDVFENADTDGNGVIDGGESNLDTNGDGQVDGTDPDGDGILGGADGNPSSRGDTGAPGATDSDSGTSPNTPNFRDLDSNGDGTDDIDEPAGQTALDTNNDGRVDNLTDPDGDGIVGGADGNAGQFGDGSDSDGDGIADNIDIDDDNDGIPDVFETTGQAGTDPSADQDGDGIPNYLDKSYAVAPTWSVADLNNDGVVDFFDRDRDGIANHLDLDSDNDGLADVVEAGGMDANGDGILDFAEPTANEADLDDDGLIDNIEASVASTSQLTSLTGNGGFYYAIAPARALDTDGDGVPDFLDLDSDNDGIFDVIESGGTDADNNGRLDFAGSFVSNDANRNGWIDSRDGNVGGVSPITTTGTIGDAPAAYVGFDKDGDGVPNFRDLDSDNDGINDIIEAGLVANDTDGILDGTSNTDGIRSGAFNSPVNTDGDTVPDYLDLDSDNDGINDVRESGGTDADNDGLVDVGAGDTETPYGDGIRGAADGNAGVFGDNANTAPNDRDGDGIPDFRDLDSDNDGINDVNEAFPNNFTADANGDGVVDGADDDGDGIRNLVDASPTFGDTGDTPPQDTDGDGAPDYRDLDSDNDGINDVIEGGNEALDGNDDGLLDGSDSDQDGILDTVDDNDLSFGDANSALVDTDNDSAPDYRDLDSDNDGINDVIEGHPNTPDLDTNGDGQVDGGDADGDGIRDLVDGSGSFGDAADATPVDTDGDGVPDYQDLDSDNDSILDVIEGGNGAFDANGDGIVDGADTDGDGIRDSVDGNDTPGTFGDSGDPNQADTDADSIPNYRDTRSDGTNDDIDLAGNGTLDVNNDGIIDNPSDPDGDGIVGEADGQPASFGGGDDSDGDGIANSDDIDDDNDGILDIFEATGQASFDPDGDADSDGTPNYVDTTPGGGIPATDSNNDGILDYFDRDRDGIANHLDLDSDNDGLPDVIEAGGIDNDGNGRLDFAEADANAADANNDGLIDNIDTGDTDDNGLIDGGEVADGFSKLTALIPNNGFYYLTGSPRALDTDGDGIPDYLDIDADNDGIFDVAESGGTDANNDGRLDFGGTFASNDPNNNGWLSSRDGNEGGTSPITSQGTLGQAPSTYTGFDKDGDNVPNFRDLDSDNDGINDLVEAGIVIADSDGILNGVSNANGARPNAISSPRNTDGDGVPDYLDLDSDNDGINDLKENFPTTFATLDINGDGLVDAPDADRDGIRDLVDGNPAVFGDSGDPNSNDADGDGVPNYRDLDSDDDRFNDVIEGHATDLDGDGNGLIDGPDTDNDGIPDAVDQDPFNFGDGVDTNTQPNEDGDLSPDYLDLDRDGDGLNDIDENCGTPGCSTLDDNNDGRVDGNDNDGDGIKDAADGDDFGFGDFGDTGLLPLELLSFTGEIENGQAILRWLTYNEVEVSHFELEHSADALAFESIAAIDARNLGPVLANYTHLHTSPAVGLNYYRLKQIDEDGTVVFSEIVVLNYLSETATLRAYPNPTTEWLTIALPYSATQPGELRILDAQGREISAQRLASRQVALKLDVSKLATGNYFLHIQHDGRRHVLKFVKH